MVSKRALTEITEMINMSLRGDGREETVGQREGKRGEVHRTLLTSLATSHFCFSRYSIPCYSNHVRTCPCYLKHSRSSRSVRSSLEKNEDPKIDLTL